MTLRIVASANGSLSPGMPFSVVRAMECTGPASGCCELGTDRGKIGRSKHPVSVADGRAGLAGVSRLWLGVRRAGLLKAERRRWRRARGAALI